MTPASASRLSRSPVLAAAALRMRFGDNMMTFDQASAPFDAAGNMMGCRLPRPYVFADGRTADSTGAFLVGELERLDQESHLPLADTQWSRDMPLREDVTPGDEVSSFTLSTFGSAGGLGAGNGVGNGKAWAGKVSTQITGIGIDLAKVPTPLNVWAMELKYSIPELVSAAQAGRPLDAQKYDGLQLKHQMDTDEQVYFGDLSTGATGLINNTRMTNYTNVPNGGGGTPQWNTKTPVEILGDVNELLSSVWKASAYAQMPNKVLLPPDQYGFVSTTPVTAAGSVSILTYLEENNIVTKREKRKLDFQPSKWLIGTGIGGTVTVEDGHDRMVAYTQQKNRIRFAMTSMQKTPIQYEGLYHKTTYWCRLGAVELVYPETIGARDLI